MLKGDISIATVFIMHQSDYVQNVPLMLGYIKTGDQNLLRDDIVVTRVTGGDPADNDPSPPLMSKQAAYADLSIQLFWSGRFGLQT